MHMAHLSLPKVVPFLLIQYMLLPNDSGVSIGYLQAITVTGYSAVLKSSPHPVHLGEKDLLWVSAGGRGGRDNIPDKNQYM